MKCMNFLTKKLIRFYSLVTKSNNSSEAKSRLCEAAHLPSNQPKVSSTGVSNATGGYRGGDVTSSHQISNKLVPTARLTGPWSCFSRTTMLPIITGATRVTIQHGPSRAHHVQDHVHDQQNPRTRLRPRPANELTTYTITSTTSKTL